MHNPVLTITNEYSDKVTNLKAIADQLAAYEGWPMAYTVCLEMVDENLMELSAMDRETILSRDYIMMSDKKTKLQDWDITGLFLDIR